ncbi:arginine transporter permease subunit ArtM [Actinobacillus equuli]|nr:arginine transporter permease subunit ArtM [Actinobacillus equuli]
MGNLCGTWFKSFRHLEILIPYALRRALPSYSNEIILVFKGTSLASTITLLDIMGYARQLYGTEYDAITIYGIAGAIYLVITGIMTILLRRVEAKVLAFERPATDKA